jgi:hypothetical protein
MACGRSIPSRAPRVQGRQFRRWSRVHGTTDPKRRILRARDVADLLAQARPLTSLAVGWRWRIHSISRRDGAAHERIQELGARVGGVNDGPISLGTSVPLCRSY